MPHFRHALTVLLLVSSIAMATNAFILPWSARTTRLIQQITEQQNCFSRFKEDRVTIMKPSLEGKRIEPSLKIMSHPPQFLSPGDPADPAGPFDYKSLDQRLESLQRTSPEAMAGFYESHLNSFSVRPGSERFSVTSSLFALESLMSVRIRTTATSSSGSTTIDTLSVLEEALMADWNMDDLFQVPLLVHALSTLDPNGLLYNTSHVSITSNADADSINKQEKEETKKERCKILIESLLDARPLRRSGQTQPLSEYLLFLVARAMSTLHDASLDYSYSFDARNENEHQDENGIGMGGFPSDALPDDARAKLSLGLSRSVEVSFNELCRQLAYWNAGDRNNFDAIRLAYSLLTYVTTSETLSGTAGIELVPGEGPTTGSVVGPPNIFLVREALRVFFEEQNEDGMWDKGQPIYKSFRRTGRNVGNAFVFATDTVGGLLKALPAEYFRPHMSSLEKTLSWIEAHQVVEVIPNYCDPVSLKCYGRALRGWSSPHLTPDTSPQAWSTAQTITCICRMRQVVRELMHEDVLREFGGISIRSIGITRSSSSSFIGMNTSSRDDIKKLDAWDRLLDTDLGDPRKDSCKTLKCVLEERFVKPFEDDFSNPTVGATYSAILFGPPGTAKTTICEALAERMGLDFLVIDTSVFLADGLTNVASRIRYVFTRLMELEQCIILFDEIEEFCLNRENQGLGMESRMLTTAMLTAINDLRRKKRSIFFLATNRLAAFDTAITRPGRFDMQLFVGTPNLEARCIQLSQKLGGLVSSVEEDVKEKALQTYRSYLQEVWTEDAMFMNYLEGLQFASACADIVASGNELSAENMNEILSSQAAVMTLRGESARLEYIDSLRLSRL